MLTLLLSRDWVACRNAILEKIREDVAAEKPGRILMVPELISHDTERRLCAVAGDTASRFAEVLSFTRLANRVAEYTAQAPESCLDNGGRVVAMAAATRQLHSRLKAYASVETKPEFLEKLLDAVDEFKRCCITSADLLAASGQTEGTLAQKLEELSLILESYDAICSRSKRDPRDRMTWLANQLADSNFGENHVFYIDGFPDYTRQHMEIMEHLIKVSPSVTVGFNCDSVGSGVLAFEKAGHTAAQLVRFAKNAGVEVEILPVDTEDTCLLRACRSLFQGSVPAGDMAGVITAYQTDSVYDEVAAAADRVTELVRGGCRYRDISIVCSDMALYQNSLRLVFHRRHIPIYQSGTEEILQKTVIATVLAAMDAALGGFEQRDVLRYLKSVLSPLSTDQCDRLENYAILWGIQGNGFLKEWTKHPAGLRGVWDDESREGLARLNEARALALEPLRRLRNGVQNSENLAGQVRSLYDFLEDISLAERLQALAEEMDEAGDNRGAQILNQLWEILLAALEQMHDVLGETVWEPETFTRLFTLLLSQYSVGTIPPVLDAVMAGPVSAMRCQQEKHLIVLGAVEGSLPGYGGSTGLLSDQERVALREMGVPLTGGAVEGIQAEFAEIYGVFCGARESVTVSYPGGQASYLYRRLAKMAGGEAQAPKDHCAAIADPAEAGAYLARWKAEGAAQALGISDWYQNARSRADFSLGSMSEESVQKLYGRKFNLSASKIDRQANCRMAYFLQYGLKAQERKESTVDPAEFGTYVHAVLEHTAREVMERGGFHKVSLEEITEIAKRHSEDYSRENFSQLDSQRLQYLFQRNIRELEFIVEDLWKELSQSKFCPEEFELRFGRDGKLPGVEIPGGGVKAALEGAVDRVDVWKDGNAEYFRIVDYKSGKKDFDYCDVFNGIGLQMLIYLFALEQAGNGMGEHPTGAGVQYFPARAQMLTADGRLSEEEAQQERMKLWKRKGLLLEDEQVLQAMEPGEKPARMPYTVKKDGTLSGDIADREHFRELRKYVFTLLREMVDDIASGNITPNPYTRGTAHDACAYCPYASVCHRSEVKGRRNYQAMTSQKFWEEIEKKVNPHG